MPLKPATLDESGMDDDLDWNEDLTGSFAGEDEGQVTSEDVTNVSAEAEDDDDDVSVLDREPAAEAKAEPEPARVAVRNSAIQGRPTGGAVAPQGSAMALLQDDGLGDVELGFGSFPIVALRDNFTAGETDLGTEFEVIVASARPKWIYKVSDSEFEYTFDQRITTKGEDLNAIVAQWKQRNMSVIVKTYRDVTAQVLSGPLEGQLAILSIPQTSVQRFDGYRVQTAVQHGLKLTDVVTKVARGEKIVRVKFPYFPWSFQFVRKAS